MNLGAAHHWFLMFPSLLEDLLSIFRTRRRGIGVLHTTYVSFAHTARSFAEMGSIELYSLVNMELCHLISYSPSLDDRVRTRCRIPVGNQIIVPYSQSAGYMRACLCVMTNVEKGEVEALAKAWFSASYVPL